MPNQWMNYQPTHAPDFSQVLAAQAQANELTNKGLQQPMLDALNRQKLQEGMLSMGSLEYAQRKKMEDDAQTRDASQMLMQSMIPNKANTGLELDQAKTFKAMLEKGINHKVAAEAMQFAGTGTGATSADKQANAIELLNQKLQATAANKTKSEDSKTNLLRLSESLSKGMYDPEDTQKEILTALELTPEDKRGELLNVITKASEQKVPDWHRWADTLLPAAGAAIGGTGGTLLGMPLVPFTGGTAPVIGALGGAGLGAAEGAALAALLTSFDKPDNAANPLSRDREFNKELIAEFISKLPKQVKK